MAVRLPADWINQADERLLEYLDSEDSAPPFKIEDSQQIDYSRTHINKRLRLMQKIGLVDMIGNGVYRITPKGTAFLAGQEDLRDVDKPD